LKKLEAVYRIQTNGSFVIISGGEVFLILSGEGRKLHRFTERFLTKGFVPCGMNRRMFADREQNHQKGERNTVGIIKNVRLFRLPFFPFSLFI
jgi:hypothetical protein